MDFGKLGNIGRVDFRWPEVSPDTAARNAQVLRTNAGNSTSSDLRPQVYVGCPAWAHQKWIGKVYPLGAKPPEFLELYSRQFNAIELNTTHYRVPPPDTVKDWRNKTPSNFRFCPKFPQEVSHHRELKDCAQLTDHFCESLSHLQDRLGTSFLQLSPQFSLQMLPILKKFLSELPPLFPVSVEFRHPSWFENHALVPVARDLLEQARTSAVITDVAGRRDVFHLSLTAPRLMVRFIGNELDPTDYTRIQDWIRALRVWINQGLREIYFFIHQPDDTLGPELIHYMIQEMNSAAGFDLKNWSRMDQGIQMNLL